MPFLENLKIEFYQPPINASTYKYERKSFIDGWKWKDGGGDANDFDRWEIERTLIGASSTLTFNVNIEKIGWDKALSVCHLMNEVFVQGQFSGVVWEVDYTRDGESLNWSMNDFYNRVQVRYTDSADAEQAYPSTTTWEADTSSYPTLGRREIIESLDGKRTADEAESYAKTKLAEYSQGTPKVVGIDADAEDSMSVTVSGFWITANNRYIGDAGDLTTGPPTVAIGGDSGAIAKILDYYCDFIAPFDMGSNSVTTLLDEIGSVPLLEEYERAGDWIKTLVLAGSDGTRYRFWAGLGNGYYKSVNNAVRHEWYGKKVGLRMAGGGKVTPSSYTTGVIRSMQSHAGGTHTSSFLSDNRDRFADVVYLAEGDTWPSFSTEGVGDDYEREYRKHLRWLEKDKKDGIAEELDGGGSGGGSGENNDGDGLK